MKHIFIINPAAGKYDRTFEFTDKIKAACKGLDYEIRVSKAPGDCERIAREAAGCGEEVQLYACGGDGTLNEVVNGVAGYENAAVTHFPGGSGNDCIKLFSEPQAFFDLKRLLDAEETRLDLIECNGRYSLSILSVGFDARVGTDVARFKRLPMVSGKGAYLFSVAANVFGGISRRYKVCINDEIIDAEQTMVCVCNGRWYGGGFNPVPEAEPDDGILDVLLVKKVGLAKMAAIIGHYQKGEYASYPDVIRHMQCSELTIECDEESVVNVDGEALWTKKAEIALQPKALRFFYPRGLAYHFQGKA